MDIFSSFFSGDWYWYLEVVLCKPIDMFVFHSLVNVFDVLFTGEWSYYGLIHIVRLYIRIFSIA